MKFIVSSTEPTQLRRVGSSSTEPEEHGCDVLAIGPLCVVGFQRKEFPGDFTSSLADGRISDFIIKAGNSRLVDQAVIILEGELKALTRDEICNIMAVCLSLQLTHGIPIIWSRGVSDTAKLVQTVGEWLNKPEHHGLLSKPKRAGSPQEALLQGLPGIGQELASRIMETVGMPIGLVKDISQVVGIGKKKLAKIKELLDA
jgi:ERCC4-type nuclease